MNKISVLSMVLLFFVLLLCGCNMSEMKSTDDSIPTATLTKTPTPNPTATPIPILTPTAVPIDYKNAVIKDVYNDYFTVGGVINNFVLETPKLTELVSTHFNSVTMENEMKPNSLLDYKTSISDIKYNECPAIDFSAAEAGLKYAKENGIKMRGHTLVWHSQTPRWLFTEGYSDKSDAPFVSKELMLKRMENYIRQVLEYVQTNYSGVIYAWDVVNEAIQPSDRHTDGLRIESNWYRIIGDEYIDKAFEYARKYADPDVKLFYNDYNTEESSKVTYIKRLVEKLMEQGTIDGIGLQTHIKIDSPSLTEIDSSVRSYNKLGLELQITELDCDMKTNTEEDYLKQAMKYKRLFLYIKKWKDDGINLTNVTFWGTTDNKSWLNKTNEPSYPLLFDEELNKKPAYYGAIQDPDIPLY